MPEFVPTEPTPKRAPTLYIIAGVKIGKGLLLLLTALGIFALAGRDLSNAFDGFLRWVHLDPEKRFFTNIGDWLDTITPANVNVMTATQNQLDCQKGIGTSIAITYCVPIGSPIRLRGARKKR